MITLEVSLNGEFVTLAGRDDLCVLNTIVDAVGVLGDESAGTKTRKEDYDLHFSVGGLSAASDEDPGEHVCWVQSKKLSVGDIVSVRILDSDNADKPNRLKKANRELNEKAIREHWEMAREYYYKYKEKYEDTAC